jgi:serine/threonine protein kinase
VDETGIAVAICSTGVGMQFIHSQRVIHRELKLTNIMLDECRSATTSEFSSSRLVNLGMRA